MKDFSYIILTPVAMRDRVILIPFLNRFEKTDENTKRLHQLKTEHLDAIASSILLAAGEFVNNSFEMPPQPALLIKEHKKYLDELDSVKQFVNEMCELGDEFHIGVTELRNEYQHFCRINLKGESPVGRAKLCLRLKGILKVEGSKNIKNKKCWTGIKIL